MVSGQVFESVKEIQKKLKDDVEMELGTHMLLKVMTKEMSGRYKKIKKVSYQGNSDKNKLLRQ